MIGLSKALWPLTLLLRSIAEGHMQIGPGQGLSGRPPLWLVPVHSSSWAYLSIPKTHSLIHKSFLQLTLDAGALGCGLASPAALCDSHGLWPALVAGPTLCQVPLPRISCPTWPQHTQLCGSGQSEWQQLFPVPLGGQDRDSKGSILKAPSLISGRGEGKLGSGGVTTHIGFLQPCLTCRPLRAGLAFSAWTCAAPVWHNRGQGEPSPVAQSPVPAGRMAFLRFSKEDSRIWLT